MSDFDDELDAALEMRAPPNRRPPRVTAGKHTAGRWYAAGRGIFTGDGVQIGLACHPRDGEAKGGKYPASYDESIANAALMAAAPAMLAALRLARGSRRVNGAYEAIEAAIKQAEAGT